MVYGYRPLTWEGLRKLPEGAPIYVEGVGSRVLRWEYADQAMKATACICAFDPATMDDTHVLARFNERRFERVHPKIWRREA